MNIIHAAADLNPGSRGACVAIGVFDGVHLGHQSVIGQAVRDARSQNSVSVVITFDRHPNSVVAPQNVPPLIYPLAKKLRVIESLGVETTWVIHFDKAFSEIPGEPFIRSLVQDFGNVRSICVGETFMFGCRRSGNVGLLKSLGDKLNFAVHAVPDVSLHGQPISSTRIRETVRAGNFDLAGEMLGRTYTLCGNVKMGEKLGRKLNFPTANLDMSGTLVPPNGVYAADALVSGKQHRAAVNIGYRPTVEAGSPALCVEAHLLDFSQDIYGQEIELTFLKKLRDEQKFPSLAALQEQIAKDVAQTRALGNTFKA
jgi:riboflavin kinase/FMN adenylyltransferase